MLVTHECTADRADAQGAFRMVLAGILGLAATTWSTVSGGTARSRWT